MNKLINFVLAAFSGIAEFVAFVCFAAFGVMLIFGAAGGIAFAFEFKPADVMTVFAWLLAGGVIGALLAVVLGDAGEE